tara:strand:+ start:1674 stop:2279 length:606 start_codon:yes stop_codon:yes gene_type:complete
MSGAFPTSKKPSVFNFSSNRPNSTAYTLSGKRSVKQFAAQYFTFSVQMPPMNQADFMEFYSFLVKQKGSFDTFTFQYPLENQGVDKAQTDIAVNGSASAGATQVPMDGFSTSTNDVLKAGDIIKFANHNKIYMITDDENANSSGEVAAVDIEPPLQAAVVNNEAVTVNQPSFTVALQQDDLVYSTDAAGFFTLSFDVREVL